jgi:hypothetical protein
MSSLYRGKFFMTNKPPSPKRSLPRVVLLTLAAGAILCVAIGIGLSIYLSVWTFNRLPKAEVQGTFDDRVYTAPNRNFTCEFPWQNVEGETLTDGLDDDLGWVKYRNDFGVNIAVQYIPERDDFQLPESLREQVELLDSLSDNLLSEFQTQFHNVARIHSEQRDIPQPASFTVSKYNMDQNAASLVTRGDLLFFEVAHYYVITFAVFESSPMYRNITIEDWVSSLDLELRNFYSGCTFTEQPD